MAAPDVTPTLWLTGLSGAGKTTLARTLAKALHDFGRRADRAHARSIVGTQRFLEIHVCTPLDTCEAMDAKGLYRRARQGAIAQFTGISAPYEAPDAPALAIDPMHTGLQAAVRELLRIMPNGTA